MAIVFIAVGYSYFAAFYRSSAREVTRLGNLPLSCSFDPFTYERTRIDAPLVDVCSLFRDVDRASYDTKLRKDDAFHRGQQILH